MVLTVQIATRKIVQVWIIMLILEIKSVDTLISKLS